MILIATFLPPTAEELVSHLDWIQEILKVVIAGVDIFGCWLLFKLRFGVSGSDIRILGTGLGWSIGENLLSRLAPLWMGARGLEFDWKYIQMSILANVNMVWNFQLSAND
jgi:hypothetical protein